MNVHVGAYGVVLQAHHEAACCDRPVFKNVSVYSAGEIGGVGVRDGSCRDLSLSLAISLTVIKKQGTERTVAMLQRSQTQMSVAANTPRVSATTHTFIRTKIKRPKLRTCYTERADRNRNSLFKLITFRICEARTRTQGQKGVSVKTCRWRGHTAGTALQKNVMQK